MGGSVGHLWGAHKECEGLGSQSEGTLPTKMVPCQAVFLTADLSCRAMGEFLVPCCVLTLCDHSSFFLGFLQKITVCWVGSQHCLGSGFSELAFARLLHPTTPLTPGVSRQVSMDPIRPCLSALLSLPHAHHLAFPFPFCIPYEWLPAPASSAS